MTNNDTQTLLEYAGTLDKIYKYSVPAYQAIDFNAGAVIRELLDVIARITQYNDHNFNLGDAIEECKKTLTRAASLIEGEE